MNKIRVLSVFGTRPEAIKMAPLVMCLNKNEFIESRVCVTAQHREMLDQVLDTFSIKPDYDLNIMREGQSLEGITTRILNGLSDIFKEERPDLVLVHGDTTTCFATALSGYYNKIKIGHVEAGLRTYNKYEPFPEEINRRLTAPLSDFNFSPTIGACENLLKEGIDRNSIFITGNTVIDALKTTISKNYSFKEDILNTIDFKGKRVIAVTAHRRENLGEPLYNICRALKRLVEAYEDTMVIYAVHKNPKVREASEKILRGVDRVLLLEPLELRDMHNLMNSSYLVMTDSGGLQEEVPSMGKPVLVLRNVTERPEGILAGTLKLAGTSEEDIFNMASELITNNESYKKMAKAKNPFGDGFASERITDGILYGFGIKNERPEDYKI